MCHKKILETMKKFREVSVYIKTLHSSMDKALATNQGLISGTGLLSKLASL